MNLEEFENLFYEAFQREDVDALVEIINETSQIIGPAHTRGAINTDFLEIRTSDLSCLACMKAGLKNVSLLIGNGDIYTQIAGAMGWKFHKLRCDSISFTSPYFDGIMYTTKGRKNAVMLSEFIEINPVENNTYHQILGRCLGYPQADIDFFCNNGTRIFMQKNATGELINVSYNN